MTYLNGLCGHPVIALVEKEFSPAPDLFHSTHLQEENVAQLCRKVVLAWEIDALQNTESTKVL